MVLSTCGLSPAEGGHADPHRRPARQDPPHRDDHPRRESCSRTHLGRPQYLAWVYQRPGRRPGLRYTGGHWHYNWANDTCRTTVLNGIVWVAGLEVPPGGVSSKAPTMEELLENQEYPQPEKFDLDRVRKTVEEWHPAK